MKRPAAKGAKGAKPSTGGGATRAEVIADVLRNAIIEQALAPGARLPEDAIGEQFSASRTIVREALASLAAEGLVQQQRNRSARVAEPSFEEARDVFDVRIAVERTVVQRLAGQLGGAEIAALREHIEKEDAAREAGIEPHSIRLAGEFHTLLAELTGSAFLSRYTRELTSRCCLILALYSRPHSAECGVSEHREIVDHLAAGAPEKAAAIMARHLGAVADRALIQPRAERSTDVAAVLARYKAG